MRGIEDGGGGRSRYSLCLLGVTDCLIVGWLMAVVDVEESELSR